MRLIACVVAIAASLALVRAEQSRPTTLVIRNVTLIDGTGAPPRPRMRVTMVRDRISSIESDAPDADTRGATTIDGTDRFLMPGLWDTHVHLVDIGEVAFPALLTYGVTSVRDAGGDPVVLRSWRERVNSGTLVAPRIKFCGPMLEGKWDPASVGGRTDHWVVSTVDDARATVERLAEAGVDCIKVRSFASPETYFALAAAARAHRLPLAGHPLGNIDPIASSDAGQRSYEHAFYPWPWDSIPDDRKKAIATAWRKNSSLVVPTLIAWDTFRQTPDQIEARVNSVKAATDPELRLVSPSLLRNWQFGVADFRSQNSGSPGWHRALDQVYDQVAELHAQGVGVMAGTDTGVALVIPGAALHRELELLVRKARFTPMDAILTATVIPAKYFGLERDLGTISTGKLADMVMLSANPLADIANLKTIVGVFAQGRYWDRTALNQLRRDVEASIAGLR